MLREMLRFWFKRTSLNAICLLIEISTHLDDRDLRESIDYLKSLREYNLSQHKIK